MTTHVSVVGLNVKNLPEEASNWVVPLEVCGLAYAGLGYLEGTPVASFGLDSSIWTIGF